MHKLNYILTFVVVIANVCMAQKWVWSNTKANQKTNGYYPSPEQQYARSGRDREPTTKRPLPGQPQNDDIDDYTDANDQDTKQHNPYIPPGQVGHPFTPGNFNGFGNFPHITGFLGNTPNGILVGAGRPLAQYPATSFPDIQGGYPLGYPATQNFASAGVNNNPGFPTFNRFNSIIGQYPYANTNNNQQFTGAQYHHQQPQYPEGYGLANPNQGFNINSHFNGNFNPNYSFGFDEYPAQVEGKSESVKTIDSKVDDKVAKILKKL